MSKLVNFKTAQLANQFGFDQYCTNKYNKDEQVVFHDNGTNIFAPTQDDLQTWLENKYGMYISIAPEMYATGINWNWQVLWYRPKDEWEWNDYVNEDGSTTTHPNRICTGTGYYGDNGEYPTRHEAMDAALQMAMLKTNILYRHNSVPELAKLYNVDTNTMLNKIRPFSTELGDWGFTELSMDQLNIIVSKLGEPPVS